VKTDGASNTLFDERSGGGKKITEHEPDWGWELEGLRKKRTQARHQVKKSGRKRRRRPEKCWGFWRNSTMGQVRLGENDDRRGVEACKCKTLTKAVRMQKKQKSQGGRQGGGHDFGANGTQKKERKDWWGS